MNPLNFVAVSLKVILVNLLAALNFADVLKKTENVWKIKKRKKTFFTSMVKIASRIVW